MIARRTFLGLLAVPVVTALVQACGDDQTPAADVDQARSDLPRATASSALAVAAATSSNQFGTTLYRRLALADPTGNIVLSPTSIAIALSMTSAGARGPTLEEMMAVLEIDDRSTMHEAMNALITALSSLDNDDVALSLANSMWGQSGLTFAQPFLDVLATQYGSGLEVVDFADDPDGARSAINEWVSDETADRIPELLADGVVTVDTRLVLVNAVYLKAPWARAFSADATTDAPFTTAAGEVVQVPSMRQAATYHYATGDGWQAVELPYSNSSLAMLIFLPEPGFLSLFEEIFLVTDATQYLAPQRVQLQLPRFDIESNVSLADQLAAQGMATAFTDAADFGGITTDQALRIAAVVHQANITVTEEGTEAAAATAVLMEATSAPIEEPIAMVVDRPFVFALRDTTTGAVLFMGRVGDPSLTRS